MDVYIKIVVPVATFLLGSALTFWMKSAEQRRVVTRSSAQEALRLAKEWYSQIHRLVASPDGSPTSTDIAMIDYVNNRLILPDFQFHLGILRRYRNCQRLVEALQAFMDEVTDNRKPIKQGISDSRQAPGDVQDSSFMIVRCPPIDDLRSRKSGLDLPGSSEAILSVLDERLQGVAHEAAAL
jgi:hypothetical protein